MRQAAITTALLVLLSSAGTRAGPMRNATAWCDASALTGVARVLAWPCHVDRTVAALEALVLDDVQQRVS